MKRTQSNSVVNLKFIDKHLTLESVLSDDEIINYVGRKIYVIRTGISQDESIPVSASTDLSLQKYEYKRIGDEDNTPNFRSLCEHTLIGVNNKNQLVLGNEFKVLHLYNN